MLTAQFLVSRGSGGIRKRLKLPLFLLLLRLERVGFRVLGHRLFDLAGLA